MANRWVALTERPRAESTFGFSLIYPVVGFSEMTVNRYKLKGLILAQNERWRRGLGMQVVREVFFACIEHGQRRKGE